MIADKMTLVFVGAILTVTGANFSRVIGDDIATALFILLPTLGFALSRREVCRLRCGRA